MYLWALSGALPSNKLREFECDSATSSSTLKSLLHGHSNLESIEAKIREPNDYILGASGVTPQELA